MNKRGKWNALQATLCFNNGLKRISFEGDKLSAL